LGRYYVGTLATTADRRLVIVRIKDSTGREGKFCSEPPPDAGQNIASALSSAMDLSSSEIPASVKVEFAKSMASNFDMFVVRTQGLQLYRDSMYHLCQNYLNGSVSETEMRDIAKYIFDKTVVLVDKELVLTAGRPGPPPKSPAPIAPALETRGVSRTVEGAGLGESAVGTGNDTSGRQPSTTGARDGRTFPAP
jgi:hypothetical protein